MAKSKPKSKSNPDRRYLEFFHRVFVQARNMANDKRSSEELGDLMEAVHNIPALLLRGEPITDEVVRLELGGYDAKWGPGLRPDRWSLVANWKSCMGS